MNTSRHVGGLAPLLIVTLLMVSGFPVTGVAGQSREGVDPLSPGCPNVTPGSADTSRFKTFTSVAIARDQTKAGVALFSASFNPADWSGRLTARELYLNGPPRNGSGQASTVNGSLLGRFLWPADAGQLLTERVARNGHGDRRIYTSDNGQGVPFRWKSIFANDLISGDLRAGDSDDALARARLDYLRGDRRNEGRQGYRFRARQSLLGDIIHSDPVYVGTPRRLWRDLNQDAPFSDFVENQQGRHPLVIVGANDGMLHAFSASSAAEAGGLGGGQELFAYIPSFSFSRSPRAGMSELTHEDFRHQFFVDLTPTIASAYFKASTTAAGARWHRVLLGGMRAGAQGLFALDITDPERLRHERNAGELLLWEFTDENLGYITQPVSVAPMSMNGSLQWVAVLGNGYNPDSGRSGLFLLSLAGNGRPADSQFIEVDSGGSGLTSDVRLVDSNGNGLPDRAYATDRQGRIWVFRPADNNTPAGGDWQVAYTDTGGNPRPLFQATGPQGKVQPITTGVMVVRAGVAGSNRDAGQGMITGKRVVLFGTGSYLSDGDALDRDIQSFYAVTDSGDASGLTRQALDRRKLTDRASVGRFFRDVSTPGVTAGFRDWFVDFDSAPRPTGERLVQMPRIEGRSVVFNTLIPQQDICAAEGDGFTMAINVDGTPPTRVFGDKGNTGHLGFAGESKDGMIGLRHHAGRLSGSQTIAGLLISNTSAMGKDKEPRVIRLNTQDNQRTGRLGWQELIRPR